MLIDGNDDRGIDVGVMARRNYEIVRMCSHVDDEDATGQVFSRDCARYDIKTPLGNTLVLLVNHFKSKGYGDPQQSAAKRLRQATRVREIYEACIAEGHEFVAIAGDLNEIPDESPTKPPNPLYPLTGPDSPLTDIMKHLEFQADNWPGTFGNGGKSNKLDYILMSPGLSAKVVRGGIERRGVWDGHMGQRFPQLPTMQRDTDKASDHAGLWVEANI